MGKSIQNIAAVTRVGTYLAKNVFQVHGVDAKGEVVVRASCGGARCCNSSPSSLLAWWRWRPVRAPITGRVG